MDHTLFSEPRLSSRRFRASQRALAWAAGIATLTMLVLFVDLWIQDDPASSGLCATAGCRLANESLRLGEVPLMIAGIVFFALMAILAILSRRRNALFASNLLAVILFGGLAFDGTLLGYQFLVLQTSCQLCLGVGISLGLIAILLATSLRPGGVLLKGAAVWIGAASAVFVLAIAPPTPGQNATVQFSAGNAPSDSPRYHFFYSHYCDQCESLLTILAATNPTDVAWDISCADTDEASLSRLTAVWDKRGETENIFAALLQAKQSPPNSKPIPEELRMRARNARTFLMNKGYTGVPLIIASRGKHQQTIVEGKLQLVQYLRQEGILDADNPLIDLLAGSLAFKPDEESLPPSTLPIEP